jgi:hypothetical protein
LQGGGLPLPHLHVYGFFKFITYSHPWIWEGRREEPMISLIKYCHSLLLKVTAVNKGEEKFLFRRPFKRKRI